MTSWDWWCIWEICHDNCKSNMIQIIKSHPNLNKKKNCLFIMAFESIATSEVSLNARIQLEYINWNYGIYVCMLDMLRILNSNRKFLSFWDHGMRYDFFHHGVVAKAYLYHRWLSFIIIFDIVSNCYYDVQLGWVGDGWKLTHMTFNE